MYAIMLIASCVFVWFDEIDYAILFLGYGILFRTFLMDKD